MNFGQWATNAPFSRKVLIMKLIRHSVIPWTWQITAQGLQNHSWVDGFKKLTVYLNKNELLVSWEDPQKSQLDGSKTCEAHLYTGPRQSQPQETESSQWEMPRAHLSEDTNLSSCWSMFVGHTFPQNNLLSLHRTEQELKEMLQNHIKITLLGTLDPNQSFTANLLLSRVCQQNVHNWHIDKVFCLLAYATVGENIGFQGAIWVVFLGSGCKVLQEHGRCTGQRSGSIGATQGMTSEKR